MNDKKPCLTIHGHFYQPPRENPWIEDVEIQESANPFHDWNERICCECYMPNSASKIVGNYNKLIDVVNNYSLMSFNMGATLLSWLEKNNQEVYKRIIEADKKSAENFSGHGNALAQVYNHIIMPLANEQDKITQVVWGIRDFKNRFGRSPEGMWLAETACDDETLGILSDYGIKFTILSPYQAEKVLNDGEFIDVSSGQIDTTKPYLYKIKCRNNKPISLFFYNAQISQAVAFEELLKDGGKFVERLKTGIVQNDDRPQIINIATDGESYGHHTKFGDMALAYVLGVKAIQEGFDITNYGEFLENNPPVDEVVIKEVSSWSCCHGVERWQNNCGCSTGGMQGWNQKWRKPLREALNFLRDKVIDITIKSGSKIFKDVWVARNDYIEVILNRDEDSYERFFEKHLLSNDESVRVNAVCLMEMQRNALLMFTSCGWFFNELSGIETTQILKYAARVIQLAHRYTDENIEEPFLDILKDAKSNISDYGNGKDIWQKFVKPNVMTYKNIVALWAITYLCNNHSDITDLYCYKIQKLNTKEVKKGVLKLLIGHLIIKSKITLEKKDVMFALVRSNSGDFHCSIRAYDDEYISVMKNLISTFMNCPYTETVRYLDEYFGKKYFTMNDILPQDRKEILKEFMTEELNKLQNVYNDIYEDSKDLILYYKNLGLPIPNEYKISAQYTLSNKFDKIFENKNFFEDEQLISEAIKIKEEVDNLSIKIDIHKPSKICSSIIEKEIKNYILDFDENSYQKLLKMFKYCECLDISLDMINSQYLYFTSIFSDFSNFVDNVLKKNRNIVQNKEKLSEIIEIGEKLNIDVAFYKSYVVQTLNKVLV